MQYTSSEALSMEEMMLRWIQTPGFPEVVKTNDDLMRGAPRAAARPGSRHRRLH